MLPRGRHHFLAVCHGVQMLHVRHTHILMNRTLMPPVSNRCSGQRKRRERERPDPDSNVISRQKVRPLFHSPYRRQPLSTFIDCFQQRRHLDADECETTPEGLSKRHIAQRKRRDTEHRDMERARYDSAFYASRSPLARLPRPGLPWP
jgi:hypothetical protein